VTPVTEFMQISLTKTRKWKTVGTVFKTLTASAEFRGALKAIGDAEHFRTTSVLFRAGDENMGIFLVCRGRVCLRVPHAPELDRVFLAGSVLGLPSTFTGNPYSLTAAAVADSDVVQIPRKDFLDLMSTRPELCREATQLLSREVEFILSALRKRHHAMPFKLKSDNGLPSAAEPRKNCR